MSCGNHRCLAVYVVAFLGMLLPPGVFTAARFTKEPPDKLLVLTRGTARFVWDYQLDRRTRLDSTSPAWYFYEGNTAKRIAYIDKYDGWIIDTKCPARLRTPTVRVSLESGSKATLVLTNVTTADSGFYGCGLTLSISSGGSQLWSKKVQLIATETPTFTSRPKPLSANLENSDLTITCAAVGPPTPNVTWVQVKGVTKVTKAQGVGSAALSITNIKRKHNGAVYECQAVNNPNQGPITVQIVVVVYYKPTINKTLSTNDVDSWNKNTVTLTCLASSGNPSPTFTWYKPNGDVLPCNRCSKTVSSQVIVKTGQDCGDYGLYRCIATNVVGSDQHYINVTQLFLPGAPNVTISDVNSSSATFRWTEPVDDGGRAITQYKVDIITNSLLINASDILTIKSISGLRKNQNYEVKLYAKNVVGYGQALSKFFTTTGQGGTESSSTLEERAKINSKVIGVLAAFLVLSLLFNVFLVLYFWRKVNKGSNSQSRKDTDYTACHENQVEMNPTSLSAEKSNDPPSNQLSAAYPTVSSSHIQPQHHLSENAIPGNPGNKSVTRDQGQLYQKLNPETKRASPQSAEKGVYEPLRHRPVEPIHVKIYT